MNRKRLIRTAVLAAAGLMIAGTVAYAAWTTTGTGSASAKAGSAAAVTLTAGTAATALYPGGSADVATVVDNSNAFPVLVSSIALDTSKGTNGFAVDAGHSGCNVSSLSFSTQSTGWTVPANGSLPVDAPGAVSMSGAANDSCQGATFTVYLTATAASA